MKNTISHTRYRRASAARASLRTLLIAAAAGVTLTACGGGGGGDSASTPAPAGGDSGNAGASAAPGKVAEGPIGGFGSVYVGGVRFSTANAKFELEGEAGSESDLEAGMVVSVIGSIDPADPSQGVADRIIREADLRGEIVRIDADSNSFTVGEINVLTDENTVFRGNGFDDLAVGMKVLVSGDMTAAGLLASFVGSRPNDADDLDRLRGRIAQLDETRLTFRIGPALVDYSAAAVIESEDGLQNGDAVVVAGQWSEDRVFRAARIRELERDDPPSDRPVRIAGIIAEQLPGNAWRIRDSIFTVSNSTVYKNGTREDLEVGARVLVIGRGSPNGRIPADEVVFRPEVDGVVEAAVQSINRERRTITVLGGLTIYVPEDATTAETDPNATDRPSANSDARRFRFEDVAEGLAIRAIGDWNGDVLIAQSLMRTEFAGNRAFLGGYIERIAPDARVFTLLGVTVAVTEDTNFGDGTAAGFFASAAPGDRVAVAGNWNGSELVAAEIRHASTSDRPRIDRVSDRQPTDAAGS